MEIKKSVRTFKDSGEMSYELLINGYSTIGVHNTYNCQMYVIAGAEEIFEIFSNKEITKILKFVHSLENKSLMLIDVRDTIKEFLDTKVKGSSVILSQQRFKSTNGNYRNILVIDILKLCTLLSK